MHSRNATIVCLKPIVSIEAPDGNESPGRRFSRKNHGRAHSTVEGYRLELTIVSRPRNYAHHTPPEKAMRTLNALVLFSVLSSECRPFSMPTMMARMMISPAEQTANDTFEILFLSMDSNSA